MRNQHKKLFIAVLMVLVLLFPTSAYASQISIAVSSWHIDVGEDVTVTIALYESYTVKSGGISVDFGSNLSYVSDSAEFKVEGATLAYYDEANHKGAFAYNSPTVLSGDILTITFKALHPGEAKISAEVTLKNGSDTVYSDTVSTTVMVDDDTTTASPTAATTGSKPSSDTTPADTTASGAEESIVDEEIDIATALDDENLPILIAENDESSDEKSTDTTSKKSNVGLIIAIIAVVVAIAAVGVVIYKKRGNTEITKENKTDEK